MSAGTKIFLAVVALFIGTVIIYYAVIAPQNDPTIERDPGAGDPSSPANDSTGEFRNELPATTNGGFGSFTNNTPNDDAARLADAGRRNDASWSAPVPRVTPGGDSIDDGGKDLPPAYGPPIPTDFGAATVQANTPISAADDAWQEDRTTLRPLYNPAEISASHAGNNDSKAAQTYTNYTVRPGDTLVYIAEDWFGDERKWDIILKANPDLKNPNRLRVGQVLKLPPKNTVRLAETGENETTSASGTYTVAAGDTLSVIAWKQYGQGSAWNLIYEANRRIIGDNPNRLKVGMKLIIPSKPSSR